MEAAAQSSIVDDFATVPFYSFNVIISLLPIGVPSYKNGNDVLNSEKHEVRGNDICAYSES